MKITFAEILRDLFIAIAGGLISGVFYYTFSIFSNKLIGGALAIVSLMIYSLIVVLLLKHIYTKKKKTKKIKTQINSTKEVPKKINNSG